MIKYKKHLRLTVRVLWNHTSCSDPTRHDNSDDAEQILICVLDKKKTVIENRAHLLLFDKEPVLIVLKGVKSFVYETS